MPNARTGHSLRDQQPPAEQFVPAAIILGLGTINRVRVVGLDGDGRKRGFAV
jgi:hypothetical protein